MSRLVASYHTGHRLALSNLNVLYEYCFGLVNLDVIITECQELRRFENKNNNNTAHKDKIIYMHRHHRP